MSSIFPIAVAVSVLILPNVSYGCPTSDDLSAGIRVLFSTGWYEVHSQIDNQRIVSVTYTDTNKASESRVMTYGVFETEFTFFDEESGKLQARHEFSYSFEPSDHFPISEEVSVRGRQLEIADDGEQYTNRYRVEMGSEVSVLIGDCPYVGIPVFHNYGSWWDQDQDQGVYFPEIGIYLDGDVSVPIGVQWMREASIGTLSE